MTALDLLGPPRPGVFSKLATWWGPRPLGQVALVCAVAGLGWWFASNTFGAMERIGIEPGFEFLSRSANFQIGEGLIPFTAGDIYARAIVVGLLNTIKAAVLGCILATVLGIALGVARLSRNLLLSNVVRWYIEVVRNTPLLLQLFFWSAVTHAFPPPRQALEAFGSVFLSNRGVFVPAVGFASGSLTLWLVAAIVAVFFGWLAIARRRQRLGGRRLLSATVITLLAIAAAFFATGGSVAVEAPALAGFNIRGGWSLTPEFTALLIGLVVKFSASIAEIVRAGIESVPRGQWEAARALGFHEGQIMRKIVLPQALRVIVPLLTSSYLDLTKDSSLAVAIGYPDLVNVINTTANTTGQSLEALAILIGIYLALNLSVSAVMNLYNRRVALRGEVQR